MIAENDKPFVSPKKVDQEELRRLFQPLADELTRLWINAGKPSQATLAKQARVSRPRVNGALTGREPASWTLAEPLVRALDGDVDLVREVWANCELKRKERDQQLSESFSQLAGATESQAAAPYPEPVVLANPGGTLNDPPDTYQPPPVLENSPIPPKRRPNRNLVLVAVGVAVILLAGMVAGIWNSTGLRIIWSDGQPPTALATEVKTIRVAEPSGELAPGLRASITTSTNQPCQRSLRSGAAAAFRCFGANHVVYDPCWIILNRGRSVGVCLNTPWSTDVAYIRDARTPPGLGGAIDPNTFWGLDLTNGERCEFAAGVAGEIDGERIDYTCKDGVVRGDPDRSSAAWTVHYSAHGSREVTTIQVRYAWR